MRRRRRNPEIAGIDLNTILIAGAVGAGVYLIYKLVSGLSSAGGALAAGAKAIYKGAQAVTAPVSTGIANLWNTLTASPAMSGVPGDVILPDGTDAGPLANMQVKSDANGNVYVQVGGVIYQLGQSDANGDWPAQIILDSDFGVTGTGW